MKILHDGVFSCTSVGDEGDRQICFYEGLKTGRPHHIYFVKPKKPFVQEQRQKGYRLDFGIHQEAEKFYAVGPMLRMDGTNSPLTDGCCIEAGDSLMLLPQEEKELAGYDLSMGGEAFFIENLNDFQVSALSAIKRYKASLWADHYSELRGILRQGNPFTGKNLETLIAHLPIEMRNMSGMPQNFGHLGLDPLQHSFIALQGSDVSGTIEELKGISLDGGVLCDEIARCAILFHDLGKKIEPFDPYHAELSGPMAEFHLECMGYNEVEKAVIRRLVETHDVMGCIKKGEITVLQGYQMLCSGLPESISREVMVKLHCEVAGADIGSIPYLRGITLEKEEEEMLRLARSEKTKHSH